jgi:hypothetical protein
VYQAVVQRWQAGASRYLVALALASVPLATALWNVSVRSAGFVDLDSPSPMPFRLVDTVVVRDVPAAAGIVIPTSQDATLLATVRFVEANTAPDEPIFVYPTSPLVYALADRPNPTRFDHLYPGAATPADLDDVIAILQRAPVNVVVVSESDLAFWGAPLDNAPLESYLANSYRAVAGFGGYRVLRRVT